jgi:hypothetical protein
MAELTTTPGEGGFTPGPVSTVQFTAPGPPSIDVGGPALLFNLAAYFLTPEPPLPEDSDRINVEGLEGAIAELDAQLEATHGEALQVHAAAVASDAQLDQARRAMADEGEDLASGMVEIHAAAREWAGSQWDEALRHVPPEAWMDAPGPVTRDPPIDPDPDDDDVPVRE